MEVRYPPELPIVERRQELLDTIRAHQVVVVAGETGSGKSTQLPKLCLELGREHIGHTQPRRLAARAVAERVAEELGVEVGGAVGFAVRFTDRTGADTAIKVMTDGILLAELQRDRNLRSYDTLIIDEAHERSLNIDFILGYLKQLLPRRPDLKVIITSATIDTARFSAHFDGAPVVEVSGRTYPVDVRYRPPTEDDDDQTSAIVKAVDELSGEGPGDILVFLSGEREIRDTADALGRVLPPGTEVLPLYARLSSAEQHRVFASHPGRRVVLATNVAETSLTVPGIRYVVDPGTARISRFNRRTKVQRLPIEPVSQASANQRAGRCGRVAPGICIRLYAEDDFTARPEFTEPEILRTNLASVILQMANIGLGDVASFPFVEPPDARSIADGMALLEELGALEERKKDQDRVRLTRVGRRLARLPVDPRLGRMVLEADRNGSVREVLVIASALAIIDPRERPTGEEQQAAQHHARFNDPDSDFLAYVNLWSYLRDLRKEVTGNQFRKRCKAEHLNWLRIREWQDVHAQLRQIAGGLDIHPSNQPADPDRVHQALLAGLLSHIGNWDENKQEYVGARQSRFTLGRASVLSKKHPKWVMAAELVETNRLWAHTAARIRPEWIERAAAHALKRTHGEPWWDEGRAEAVCEERATLYGLPIVAARRVAYARVDPAAARDLFVHHALVLGEWPSDHGFIARNAAVEAEVRALEAKARRPDVLVGDDVVFDLFDARVPDDITSGKQFDRWWRIRRRSEPDLLDLTVEELTDPEAGAVAAEQFPDTWIAGDLRLPLTYVHDPDSALDGVTVDVPLDVLNRFDGAGLDWQVPGHRTELVTTLVRSLPKPLRRNFVPVPDHVRTFLTEHGPSDGPLLAVLGRALTRMTGDRIPAGSWRLDQVAPHLLVNYRAVDERGRAVAWSKDLPALQTRLAGRVRAAVAASAPSVEQAGLTAWTIGELPRVVETERDGRVITAHPTLVDEGDSVSVRAVPTAAEQDRLMTTGTRRLLLLSMPGGARSLRRAVPDDVLLALAAAPWASAAEVLDDCLLAAVDALVDRAGGPVWDAVAFDELAVKVREDAVDVAVAAVTIVGRIATSAADLRARLAATTAPSLHPAIDDMRAQLDRLVHPGFVVEAGVDRLRDVERYLLAIKRRLEKVADDAARDRRSMALVQALEGEYSARRAADVDGTVGWMLEELRVSLFAQAIGTRGSVSEQRIRKALSRLRKAAS
jgi:ATP-dependent helicase HrpA